MYELLSTPWSNDASLRTTKWQLQDQFSPKNKIVKFLTNWAINNRFCLHKEQKKYMFTFEIQKFVFYIMSQLGFPY